MTDWKEKTREERGMLLAAMVKITQRGDKWIVPSQTGDGTRYTVNPDDQTPECTCPDFELHGCTCKHIYAVRIVRQRELFDDGTEKATESVTITQTVERKTYAQQWPVYNRAQSNEKDQFQELLSALCEGIQEPPRAATGRPRITLASVVFSACFKVYSTLSGRRFMSDLRDAEAKGYVARAPQVAVWHGSSAGWKLSRRQQRRRPQAKPGRRAHPAREWCRRQSEESWPVD